MFSSKFSAVRRVCAVSPRTMNRHTSFRARPCSRIHLPDRARIELTETESDLCTLLDECTNWLRLEKGVETSCRIAGGWVRDKLLGSPSNDIDIALESIMGVPFAEYLVEYCSSVKGMEMDKIAKIESNPDRSKHLETARTNVFGIELDFVNLRSEEFAEDSRIPTQVAFGTPLQDALRRDTTINALFYNVHSRAVEDFTEKGLADLKNGVIRTPLPPRETFMDDPLRVLRCVRFSSRLGFELDPEITSLARDPQIQDALRKKISRERVGEEIDKMMKGQDPLRAIQLLNDLSLYDPIFHIPPTVSVRLSSLPSDSYLAFASASVLHLLTQPPTSDSFPNLHPLLRDAIVDKPTQARLYLACALLPFLGITYQDAKKKTLLAVDAAIRESLRLGTQNHYLDGIPVLYQAVDFLKERGVSTHSDMVSERVSIGLLLKDKRLHNIHTGSNWQTTLLFSLTCELIPMWDHLIDNFDEERASERIEAYNALVSRAESLDLLSTADAKPILDGNDVVRVVDAGRPGPWLADVLSQVMIWQLDHPGSTKQDCEAWLSSQHTAGALQIKRSHLTGGNPTKGRSKRGNPPDPDGIQKKTKTENA